METTGRETEHQTELINASKSATMLFKYVCDELDADHPNEPGYAASHPQAVAACMNAAALLHIARIEQLAGGLVERFK